MPNFAEAIRDTIGNNLCTILRTSEAALGTIVSYSPVFPAANAPRLPLGMIRWGIRNFCNYEPPAFTNPPFSGGQCPINYTVNTTFERQTSIAFVCQFGSAEFASNSGILGPIVGLEVEPGDTGQALVIVHGGGSLRTEVTEAADSPGCPGIFRNFAITSVVPPVGVPDDCGNPVPTYPDADPPPLAPIDIEFIYQDNDDIDQEFEGTLVFAPVSFDFNGEVNIPFRINIDPEFEFKINGKVNLNTGDITFDFGNNNFNPSPNPQPDDYRTDEDIPDVPPTVPDDIPIPSPDDTEPDTQVVIRGVIVSVLSYDSDATQIGQGGNPDIYAPNLGFVSFGCDVGGIQAWTTDLPVKNFRQIIECPWVGGATLVRGTPRPGVEWVLSPVRETVDEPIVFE